VGNNIQEHYKILLLFILFYTISLVTFIDITYITNASRILVGKREGKRPLERPKLRWVDNIKMNLREMGLDGMDRIDLVSVLTFLPAGDCSTTNTLLQLPNFQAGDYLTPTYYSSHCRLKTLL
jgi:hypothetical protein